MNRLKNTLQITPKTSLLNQPEDDGLTNTQLFCIICGTCYAITTSILLLTAWCHARRANHLQDRRHIRKRSQKSDKVEQRIDHTLDNIFETERSNPASFRINNQENRVTQEQLMEDGILTEKEINKSFVTSVDG